MYAVYGIHVAKECLIKEIHGLLNDLDKVHVRLLANVMTSSGLLISVDRHGVNKTESGLLGINYNRSDGQVGNFTDAVIYDGKRAEVARFQGSSKNLLVKGDIIAFSTSDKNLKDDIKNIENPLDKVSKLNGVTFTWNDKQNSYKGSDVGIIAQEVEKIIPEAVTIRDTGYKAVKYEKIIPLLIESIKELIDKTEALEAKIAEITQ
jgi:hypothetical protein